MYWNKNKVKRNSAVNGGRIRVEEKCVYGDFGIFALHFALLFSINYYVSCSCWIDYHTYIKYVCVPMAELCLLG